MDVIHFKGVATATDNIIHHTYKSSNFHFFQSPVVQQTLSNLSALANQNQNFDSDIVLLQSFCRT